MNYDMLKVFMSGGLTVAYFVAATFFLRFWRRTKDSFFGVFSAAFWLMGAERVVIVMVFPKNIGDERHALIYLIRLIAFIAIIVAILQKNRART